MGMMWPFKQYLLLFFKIKFWIFVLLNLATSWTESVLFFFLFLGSGKGEALITVIANHIPHDKKQDVDEEQQFWTFVLQKRVEEKTLASVWVKGAEK